MKKTLKRTLVTFLTVIMLFSALPLMGIDFATKVNATQESIKIGDKISFGTYNGEPIIWICAGFDENGALMVSEKVICFKPFDAKGENSFYHNDGWGYIRKDYGSNCWVDSNIRQWLNSNQNTVSYTHCPPTKQNVRNGYNAYSDESGFLTNFNDYELSLIKTVTNVVNVNEWEPKRQGYCDGGKKEIDCESILSYKSTTDFTQFYYQNVNDKIFLLNNKQIAELRENLPDYLNAYPTSKAVSNNQKPSTSLSTDTIVSYWTATPGTLGESFEHVQTLPKTPRNGAFPAYDSFGIRPAFYLEDNFKIEYPISGTFESYVIATDYSGRAWISSVKINGTNYDVNENLLPFKSTSEYDSYIGQRVVAEVNQGSIVRFEFVTNLKSELNCTISTDKDQITYTNKNYSDKNINVDFYLYNRCSDPLAYEEKSLDIYVNSVTFSTSNPDLIKFKDSDKNNEKNISIEKNITCGNNLKLIPDANEVLDVKTTYKIKDNVPYESVIIYCKADAVQNGQARQYSFSKEIRIINNNYTKPINASNEAKKAAEELSKIYGAITLGDTDLNGSLTRLCPRKQLDEIENLLYCMIAIYECPKDTFKKWLSDSVIDFIYNIGTNDYNIEEGKISLTTYINLKKIDSNSYEKYGNPEITFEVPVKQLSVQGIKCCSYSNIYYTVKENNRIKKYNKNNPDNKIELSGLAGGTAQANLTNFSEAMEKVITSEFVNEGFDKIKDAHEAVNKLFTEPIHDVLLQYEIAQRINGVAFWDIEWSILNSAKKHFTVRCPVDIYIYNSQNQLVASVIGNNITINDKENISINLNGDEKNIELYNNGYSMKYVSAADGELNITVYEYANDKGLLRTVGINNVPLKVGIDYTQNIDDEYFNDSDYSLTSNEDIVYSHSFDDCALHTHQPDGEWAESGMGYKYSLCPICNEWVIELSDVYYKVNSVSINDIDVNYKSSAKIVPQISGDDGVNYTVKYESSNPSVATVDKNGNISTVHKGSTTITCTVTDEYGNTVKDTCTVNVKFQWWQWLIWILLFGFLWY